MTSDTPSTWTMREALGGPGWWLGPDGRWHPPEGPVGEGDVAHRSMSQALGGPGWWLGSDGRWRPPEPVESFETAEADAAPAASFEGDAEADDVDCGAVESDDVESEAEAVPSVDDGRAAADTAPDGGRPRRRWPSLGRRRRSAGV